MAERKPLGLVPRLVAAVVVLVTLGMAVGVLLFAHRTADLRAGNRTREVATNAVPAVAATLRTVLTQTETSDPVGTVVPLREVATLGVPEDVAVQVRDTGRGRLIESSQVVMASYGGKPVPKDVTQRRATFTGIFVVPVDLGPTLESLRPPGGGVAVTGPDRVVASIGDGPSDAVSTFAAPLSPALAQGWAVRVWTPRGAIPVAAWVVAALCLLAGALGARFVIRRAREVWATEEELDRLHRQSTVLAGLAGVAQRSLDLADVLPAVSTQLSDALGLRGLSLTSPTPDGERAFFRDGDALAPAPALGMAAPSTVPAGQSASVLLARAGRTVARLNVLAGRDLDPEDVVVLEAAGEILTSALINAEAFARQREALQRLRGVDELKTVFLATASHELRTPVGVISGFAELLSRHVEDLDHDRVRDYAGRIETTAQQLASLVENLLDFSRMERGVHGELDHTSLDLGVTVTRILDQHEDLSANHRVVTSAAQGVCVRGTEHAVERVLTNLVGNAAKYSPAGTTIRVLVRQEGDRAALHVDDEGPGVPAADRAQVFSRFYRGRGDEVVNTRGAGLGLAIVHEFAATMGGVASVSEAPTGGARFTVLFPVDRRAGEQTPEQAPEQADSEEPAHAVHTAGAPATPRSHAGATEPPAPRAPAEGTSDVLT